MAGLRKLFSIERTLFQSTNPELMESESNGPVSGTYSPCLALPRGSPEAKLPRLPQMQNQTFYGIERQFEDLHDQFCCHQSLSRQNKRFRNAEPTSSPHQIRRHVDVIEAGFPAQHARVPTPISPATLSSQESENIPPRPAPQPQLKIYKVAPDRQPSTRDAGESSRFNQSLVNPPKQLDVKPRNHDSKKATPKCPTVEDGSNRLLSPASANLSRKNVRDLSINTKLAAPTKNFVKVPTQPPVLAPAGARREPNSSIAGIVNSPLPVATPSAVSPRTSSYNVEEIMIASDIETMPFPEPSPVPIPIKQSEINGHTRRKSSSKSLSGKEKQSLRLVGRNSFAKTRRNSYTSGKELSFPAIKGLEAGTEPDSSHQERRRRHTYSQPLPPSVPVAPEFPRELRQEAGKASLGRSGDSPQPKYTYKLIPDIRPKSSHSVRSKGPPSRLGKSGSSKQTQSCRPALVCQNSQSEMAQRTSSRNTPAEQTKPDLPKYQSDNPKNGERDTLPGLTNSSCTTPEPKIVTSSFPQQTSQKPPIKRLFSTSPQQIGRNRIPLRRSSIQKDLFDSGRFKL
ncbi:hypothetical protein I7I51_01096 [Histoplasma capsulatum]|uniref:Uncharacterized protein n=1 Tax=Ajellomyces capsulatus TaxID=5037 RepID=A0A8A1MDS1_AJECA|nr:hypothetical protein I7I51_01096 [Histoplasma capsulatum]